MNDILSISFFTYVISYILFLYSVSSYTVSPYTVILYCSNTEHICSVMTHTHYLTSEESIYSNQSGRCPEPHQELVPGPICSVAQNQARGRSVIFLLTQAYSFQQCQGRCKLINQPLTLIYIFFLTSYSFYVMI